MMQNFYNFTAAELSAAVITLNIILAFLAAAGVVWVYRKTHRGLSYSRSFLITLVMICVLGSVVMMVVQENLIGAFALLGAFSMIRFRTIVKDTKDVAFVFFALVEGVAIGTNNYSIAGIALVLISGVLLLMHRSKMGAMLQGGYLVLLHARSPFDAGRFRSLLTDYSEEYHILHVKSSGEEIEYSVASRFKLGKEPDKLISELKTIPGVLSTDIMTGKESVEY